MSKFYIHGTNRPTLTCLSNEHAKSVSFNPTTGLRAQCPVCGTIDDAVWPHTPALNEECCIPAGVVFLARDEKNSAFKLAHPETVWADSIEWCNDPYIVIGGDRRIFGDEHNYCIMLKNWKREWEYSHAFSNNAASVATLPPPHSPSAKVESSADVATA